MRRALATCGVVAVLMGIAATPARAHALLGSADPEAGSSVEAAPAAVSIRFTEEPEPSLSGIDVLDASGRSYDAGDVEVDTSDRLILRQQLTDLPDGVYTVTWRVISKVDGHLTGGAFAFGVNVDPAEVVATPVDDDIVPRPSVLEVASRWLLYAGLALMIGASLVGLRVFERLPGAAWPVAGLGWVAAAVGVGALAEAQRRAAGVPLADLLDTTVGRALIWRMIAVAVAGIGLAVARARQSRGSAAALLLLGLGSMAALWFHVSAGHAGAGTDWPTKVIGQWVHAVAASVWLGGLAALIAGVRGGADEAKARAVRRYSALAGWALVIVVVTGISRSLTALPGLGDLFGSSYGLVIVAKVALVVVLAMLGGVNRHRNVPAARSDLAGLRRVSRAELSVGATALAAAALLAAITPPAPVSALESIASDPIVVTGTDLGNRMRAELRVDPGFPGPNAYTLRLTEPRTGAAFEPDSVRLIFRYVEDAALGESELALESGDDGAWRGSGAQIGLPGRWRVTVLAQRASDAVEVGLDVATKCRVTSTPIAGAPTLHDVTLGNGTGQGYVDPAETGFNEVHITFFDAAGSEEDVTSEPAMFATPEDGDRVRMVVRRFGPGHFIGDAQLTTGVWRFDVDATGGDGQRILLCFNEEIG